MGQHLFLNITPNDFMLETERKVWCDRGMSGKSENENLIGGRWVSMMGGHHRSSWVQVIMTNHNNNNPDGRVEECKLKGGGGAK